MPSLKAISYTAAALAVGACSVEFKREHPKSDHCLAAEERLASAEQALGTAEGILSHNPLAMVDGSFSAHRTARHAKISAQSDVAHHCAL